LFAGARFAVSAAGAANAGPEKGKARRAEAIAQAAMKGLDLRWRPQRANDPSAGTRWWLVRMKIAKGD
jgi:hypothetical protein